MSKYFLIALALVSFNGCSETSSGPRLSSGPTPTNQPQKKAETQPPAVTPPEKRVASDEFFLSVRLTDELQANEIDDTRTLVRNPSIYPDGIYRASSPIFVGNMIPDAIEISFPLPPEVTEASDDTVQVHFGCGGGRSPDIYPVRGAVTDLDFSIVEEMPRGTVRATGLYPMFHLCNGRYVTVAVAFYGHDSRVHSWEQVYLDDGSSAGTK